jgi:hypothetical protein
MAWSRRKEENPDHDAELRQLVNAYARAYDPNSANVKQPVPKASPIPEPSPSSTESVLGMPTDDLINGRSFSYTPAEAKLYADVEPCDTWRHFDVLPFHLVLFVTSRNGFDTTYRCIWDRIIIAMEYVGRLFRIGMSYSFV